MPTTLDDPTRLGTSEGHAHEGAPERRKHPLDPGVSLSRRARMSVESATLVVRPRRSPSCLAHGSLRILQGVAMMTVNEFWARLAINAVIILVGVVLLASGVGLGGLILVVGVLG